METLKQTLYVKPTARGFRIWLEGSRLDKAGFSRHAEYTRTITENAIVYTLGGDRKVSGRSRNNKDIPIIEYAGSKLDHFFSVGDKLTATYTTGNIAIIKED
jgi:hypothetical protein